MIVIFVEARSLLDIFGFDDTKGPPVPAIWVLSIFDSDG